MKTLFACIGMVTLFIAGLLTGMNEGATILSLILTCISFPLVAWGDME